MPTKDFTQTIKHTLLIEKARLENDLKDIGHEDPKQPGRFAADYDESGGNSEDDNAAEVTNFADDQSIVSKLENELKDVNKALEAIEKGTYGICKYCKQEIDVKRLEARPTSTACIACKKLLTQEL